MPSITPSLWFDGNAEEAVGVYISLFPNSSIGSVARYGPDTPGTEGAVMGMDFVLDGRPFTCINGGPEYPFTAAVSFKVDCRDQDEVDHYWFGLLEGGGQEVRCGWLRDRFGLSWQIVPAALGKLLSDPDPERANRAMQAMLGMNRLVVADLEKAADGVDQGL